MNTKNLHTIIRWWTLGCQYLLAVVFIFSGFVKANDPLGTVYKIQDYLEAMNLLQQFPSIFPLLGAVGMALLEFSLGVYLLFGIHKRWVSKLMLLVMLFMTPLTLWLAWTNPISDCGCFGDVLVLSNWETFFKNLILLLAAFSIYKWYPRIHSLVTDKVDWLIAMYSSLFIFGFSLYCYRRLPVFDFRPYYIGANIREGMEIPEGKKPTVYETKFIYEKDGEQQLFTEDNLPVDTLWRFVDALTEVKEKGYEPPILDFSIVSQEDGTSLTDSILDTDNYVFLLIAHRLEEADDSTIDLINEIYDYSLEYGYTFYCLTSSSDEVIAEWQERTGAEYNFALMDDIVLKTVVRSNPGMVLLKKGTILNKWSLNNLPDEYQLSAPLHKLPLGYVNQKTVVHKITEVILCFIIPLLVVSVLDFLWLRWKKRKKQTDN